MQGATRHNYCQLKDSVKRNDYTIITLITRYSITYCIMCHLLYLLFDWISENDEKRVHSVCTRQTLLLWHLSFFAFITPNSLKITPNDENMKTKIQKSTKQKIREYRNREKTCSFELLYRLLRRYCFGKEKVNTIFMNPDRKLKFCTLITLLISKPQSRPFSSSININSLTIWKKIQRKVKLE